MAKAPAAPAKSIEIDAPALTLRADIRAESIDPESRTVELVWTTGARVLRGFFDRFYEELSLDPKHVRMDRLTSGRAPVLAAHDSRSLDAVIGVVESARLEKTKGIARVRFAKDDADADAAWNKITQGILRNVSVGYQVFKYEKTVGGDEQIPVMRATDWEPFEVSIVPMGADADAKVRAGDTRPTNPCVIVTRTAQRETSMPPTVQTPVQQDQPQPPALEERVAPPVDLFDSPAPPATQADPPPNDRDLGAMQERTRADGIRRAIRAARLAESVADDLIRRGLALVDAQSEVFRILGEQDRGGPQVTANRIDVMTDASTHVFEGIRNALLHRVAPSFFKLEAQGHNYRGLTLMECARLCLHARGIQTTGMSKLVLAGAALGNLQVRGPSGYHTTSDFALLLADVMNKTLRRAYDEAPQTFTTFSRRITLPDFKTSNRLQIGDAPQLLKVQEHGEFTRGTIGEAREQFALSTYGRVLAFTRQAMINDDTDAFSRVTMLFGRSARDLESNLVWAQITGNPVMGDGVTLFHATHGNLAGSGAVISVTTLGAARSSMRLQRGLGGETYLNITPRYLVVPAAVETAAAQQVAAVTPALPTSVNPFSGLLQVIAEPRLDANSATAWYVFASAADSVDTVEYAFLEGEEGPQTETRIGFDIDGIEIKCRHDFAAKAIDYKGVYKNPGA